jgi:hypothetical protein
MSLKKFESKDILYNVLETNPKQKIQVYNSEMYLNDERASPSGSEYAIYSYRQNFESTTVGSLPAGWSTYGVSSSIPVPIYWQVTGSEAYDGTKSAGSDPSISDNESTSLVYTASVAQDETLTFWWKVSLETNFDFLRFYINEVE